ncbi:MAG: hypothetical protein WD271_04490 [Acidimicrobiia bacterium]
MRDAEPEGLALPEAGAGGEHDERSVAARERVGDCEHDVCLERLDALPVDLRQRDAIARAHRDESVGDGALEDRCEVPVHDLDGRRLHLRRELLDERLDLRAPDRSDRPILEPGQDVQPQVRVDLNLGRRSMHARRLPFAPVLAEALLAAGRVDVSPVREVAADGVEPLLGVALLDEAARAL